MELTLYFVLNPQLSIKILASDNQFKHDVGVFVVLCIVPSIGKVLINLLFTKNKEMSIMKLST